MNTKFDARQSDLRIPLPMVGSIAQDTLDTIFPKINNELSKLFEDRNVLLTQGGEISFNGSTVSFTEPLLLELNSQIAGGSPTLISLGSTTRTVSASGRMIYAIIDRLGGTATVTDDAATLPAVTSANQEVFLIAKREDAGDGTQRLYFRDGFTLSAGQTARLGAGGGGNGSGINYITNPDAESSTTGWSLYQNTAANIPSTGTGGTPSGITLSRSTSAPLRGIGSFLLVQANSTNIQGQGVSAHFTIDSADQAKALVVSFDYNASNTFVASNGFTTPLNDGTTSTNAGNSDVEVFVYDITNAVLIPVTPEVLIAKGSNNFSFAGTFQTATNSLSYRLIFHVATANANATGWSFKFDNVFVGPQEVGIGDTAIKPTQTILTSGSGTYTPPSGVSYIRVRMVGGGGGGQSGDGPTGSDGSDTSFGTSLLVAHGGGAAAGGGGGGGAKGGIGGTASIAGLVGLSITGGGGGGTPVNTGSAGGSSGGASMFGGAGFGGGNPGGAGSLGGGGGGGGTNGGSGGGGSGGAGGGIDVIIATLLPSYPYTVGSGGSGGLNNGNGFNGGDGGDGVIVIDEHYLGSNGTSSANPLSTPTIQVFTSGSGTYTLPNGPSPLYIEVEMVGGGGSGGSVGANGLNGISTTFGSILTCTGGGGGAIQGTGTGGTGGTFTIGAGAIGFGLPGVMGASSGDSTAAGVIGGFGGASPFGGQGYSVANGSGSDGLSNTGSGGGGTGTNLSQVSINGGGGGGSGGYLKAIIKNPSSSYPFTVGAGGAGTGSSGEGGSGVLIVREYYANSTAPSVALVSSPSVHPIGADMAAYLTEQQFQLQMGPGWVLQDGRSCVGSTYAQLTGNTNVPDHRGLVGRGAGANASQTLENGGFATGPAVGVTEQDMFASHIHDITFQSSAFGSFVGSGTGGIINNQSTGATGGAETRGAGIGKNYFIKIN